MTVTSLWVGALTPSGARVRAKLAGVTSARLAVDTDPAFSAPVFFGPDTPTAQGMVTLDVDGLAPGGTYFYAIEEDSVLNTGTTGRFRTIAAAAGEPVSFTFAASGDAGLTPDFPDTTGNVLATDRISNAPVFDTIREHPAEPLFFMHLGDLTYYDLGSDNHGIVGGGSIENYRRQLDDVLLQSRQHELYRTVPLVYTWDDHDFGPNNSDGTLAGKGNAATAYREKVPAYPLSDPGAIYHSFQVGRVLFVVLDCRFYRSPNSDPDGPSKTMLGAAQKAWLSGVLGSSTAEALVVVSSVRWMDGSIDSWPGFGVERQELADLFTSSGWADRMVMVNADAHTLAMDSGASNEWGGFPVYLFASLDATPSTVIAGYDVGISNARDQYGIVQVDDTGSSVTITALGYQGAALVMSHTLVIGTEPEPPPPPPPPVDVLPVGTVSPVVRWHACDLVTGQIIADLLDVETDSISRLLGAYTSSGLRVPIAAVGPRDLTLGERIRLVEQATEPHRTMIVAIVNDQPAWGGYVTDQLGGTDAELELPCSTLESYFLHRYVRDHTWVQQDEASVIAAGLAADAGDIPGIGTGTGLEIDAVPTGTLRDRTYLDADNATVYDRLQELMAVLGGPEWTIELLWGDDTHTWIRKVLRIRDRIGVASSLPNAVFETTPQSVFASQGASAARYRYAKRRGGGLGANVIQAYSSGEGEDQPRSDLAVATDLLDSGFPIFERRFQPASGIKEVDTLNDHAQRDLELRRNGQLTWEIEARWNVTPRLNIDWRIGDDVGWNLKGHRHPGGVDGQGRCIGWVLNPGGGTVRPILLDPLSNGG